MDKVKIHIKNFEKYRGRSDIQNYSWFRCSNRIFEDADFFDFSHEEFCVWIFLLCMASQKNAATFEISLLHAERVGRLSPSSVLSAIKKLIKLGCLEKSRQNPARGRNVRVTCTDATEQDNTDSNDTGTDITCAEASCSALPEFSNELFQPYMSKVQPEVQHSWFATYESKDWVVLSIKQSIVWIKANPQKAPKSQFAKFFTSWLARTWEWQRTGIKSKKVTYDEDAFLEGGQS